MHTPLLHDSLSLTTTIPVARIPGGDADIMGNLAGRRVRWEDVHRQARRIAARNVARRRVEEECSIAERRAQRALNRVTHFLRVSQRALVKPLSPTYFVLLLLCVVTLGVLLFV